jgi:diguanylate cyclase (GGDEF)-like protein
MIFIYDKDGNFVDNLSDTDDRLLYKKDAYIGHHLSEILPFDITERTIDAIKKTLSTGKIQEMEYSLSTKDKTQHYETRLQKLNDQQVIAVVRNITERINSIEHIERLSYRDQLTGLYNRHFFNEELARHDNQRMLPLSLVLIDVNGLKLANDAFGHLAGDELLKKVAAILVDECRSSEIIARIGGDEFIILLPNTENKHVGKLVTRITNRLEAEKVKDIPVSISVGWATKTKMDQDIQSIFIQAENKMYRMKLTESQSMRNGVIRSIMSSLKDKSELERDHSENVSLIALKLGRALNLNSEQLGILETAALVHDIGKIAMDDAIINKMGSLTQNEYEEVKRHPEVGYQILKLVNNYSGLSEYVLYHHENWDGSGYPRGLKGENIPLISRLISIADAYEAMTSKRPFREKYSHAEALERIRSGAGTLYDPNLVKLFVKII